MLLNLKSKTTKVITNGQHKVYQSQNPQNLSPLVPPFTNKVSKVTEQPAAVGRINNKKSIFNFKFFKFGSKS